MNYIKLDKTIDNLNQTYETKVKELQSYISTKKIAEVGIFNADVVAEMITEIISLPAPVSNDDYYSLMKLEWGLMIVLTVQILHVLFVEKTAPCFNLKPG